MHCRRPLKLLLVGHSCSADLGSEPGLTWNWARYLSGACDVWVLAHPQYRQSVDGFLARHPHPQLHFVWTELPPALDPWKPEQGEQHVRLHYLFWQHAALLQARRLQRAHRFDLVHHVSWNTVSAPPRLWSLGIPFVWGPIGGGQRAPASFRRYFGPGWRKESLRNLRVRLLPLSPFLRKAAQKSAFLLSINPETTQTLKKAGASEVHLFPDSGIVPRWLQPQPPQRKRKAVFTLLWAGRLELRKGFPLALEALAAARSAPVRMLVAGAGPMEPAWRELTRTMGLQKQVQFLGMVPWKDMPDLFLNVDAFFCTSLQDSFPSIVLEAMACGLPILTLSHHGAGTFVPAEAGIKAPVTTPEGTVMILAKGIEKLAGDPDLLWRMGEAAFAYAKTQTWDRRAAQMLHWYHEVLDAHCAF